MTGQSRREHWPPGFQPHDPRSVAAHAWFEAAIGYDFAALPEASVRRLFAEGLELFRQLLDVADEADMAEDRRDELGFDDYLDVLRVVKPEQAETLGQALADAIEHRTPAGRCEECEARPEGLCDDHAADLDLTDAYLALARELGIEVSR
jgi:hypothetical protein